MTKKIIILLPTLTLGGAEKQAILSKNHSGKWDLPLLFKKYELV